MPDDFREAIEFIDANKANLGVPDPDIYIANLKSYLSSKTEESQKSAVLLAVDASKSLITIGIAFFAALGAFALNYRSTHANIGCSPSIVFLAVAALLTILSMWSGFSAIGKAYKRGQRPADADGPSWATKPLSGILGAQSLFGLAALVCFGVAVFIWDANPDVPQVKMQGTLDDIDTQIDKQNSILSKFNQNMPDLQQPITELSGHVKKIAGVLDAILAQLPSLATKPIASPRYEGDLTQLDWSAIQTTLASGSTLTPVSRA